MVEGSERMWLLIIAGASVVFVLAALGAWLFYHNVLEASDRRHLEELEKSGPPAPIVPPEPCGEVLAHLHAGRKIEAIKVYRRQSGVGLREAKYIVEKIESRESNPN